MVYLISLVKLKLYKVLMLGFEVKWQVDFKG